MKILELYKAILISVGGVIDEDGLVSMSRPDDEPVAFMVSNKRLAIPTNRLLDAGAFNPDGKLIAFHPICENVVLENSPVLEKLNSAMTFRLTWVMRELIRELVIIAADPKLHKKLKMKAHGLLSAMPEASERTRKDLTKVLDNTTVIGSKKLLALYVRSGGMYGGEKVSRLGRFSPSIVDALDTKERKLLGVSLLKADVPAFLALIEYILPDYQDADRYNAPSNSLIAPTFHALVKTFYKVATQLNKIIDLHAEQLSDPNLLRIPLDWIDQVQDLSPYRDQIPVLPGNDGKDGTVSAKIAAPKPIVTAASAAQLKQAAKVAKTGISVDDLVKSLAPAPVAAAPYGSFAGRPAANGWNGRPNNQASDADLPPWARPVTSNGWGGVPAQPTYGRTVGGRIAGAPVL